MDRFERISDNQESLRLAIEDNQAGLWTAMPGIVESVDLDKQTLTVQPAIQGIITATDGTTSNINLPLLVDVPVCWPRAGGFALTFPIASGDEVLVVFASRCIDSWWQSGGIGNQAEYRMHDLSDGFAILAPTSQPKVLGQVSTINVQLRNESGATYLEITPAGKINIVAGAEVTVTAPTMNITANVNVTGDVKITGKSEFIGNITQSTGSLTSGGIVYNTHRHGGVTTGSGNTGTPV